MTESNHCPDCGRKIPVGSPDGLCPHCLMGLGVGGGHPSEVGRSLGRDRNLLFGLLALQLRFIRPEDFLDTAAAWSIDPTRNLADRLVDAGSLNTSDRVLVEGLVDEAIVQHGGDERRTLQTFGGEPVLAEHVSRIQKDHPTLAAATKLGIPLGVEDVDSRDLSAVDETPGRYTRNSEYSRGGMGRILLVHDEYLSRDVALKELIPPRDDSYPTSEEGSPVGVVSSLAVRFLREAKLTGQLEHPSIVPVYELGRRPNGTLYYTMKLVRGQTLAQALRNVATLSERLTFLSHFVGLCQALGYAHSRNVIHRDIKPSNIMIGEFGETVVIDWGLAKVIGQADIHEEELRETWSRLRGKPSSDPDKTQMGTRLGTPHYMAPEQARGKVDAVDQRTDVFALGTVLYELLTGILPFESDSTEAIFDQVIECVPRSVGVVEPSVPPELVGICQRAMQKDPKDRYQDAKEMADDVQRFLTGAVVHAYEYSAREILNRFYRRHRTLITATASALLLVLAGGIFSYINIGIARDEALLARDNEVAARQAASAARAVAEDKTYVGQIRLVQQYMDNRNFALARDTLWGTQLDRRDWAWGFLMNRLDQALYTIPDFVAGAMSPDGQRIAAISISHPITIFDSNDGSMILEFDPLTRRLTNEVEFSPDGRHLVGACLDRRVRVWDTSNGALLLTLRGHLGTLNSTTYDASGQRIVSAGGMSARVWDATTGDAISAFRGHCNGQPDCRVWRAGFVPDSALAYSYGNDGFVRLWDAESGEERLAFEGGNVVVDASGSLIGVTSGVTVHVWNIETGAQQCELTGHRAQVGRLAFSPSGEEIYSTSEDGTIRCWDTDSGVERRVFLHPGRSHRLAFSSDGTLLAAVNSDGLIKIWDLDGNEEINSFRSQNRLAYSVAFFANDTKLMTGARESQVMAWGVGRGIGQAPIATLEDGVQNFDLSGDDSHIAVVGRDNVVSLLRSDNGATEAALTSFDYRARSAVAVSHTGRYVVAATDQFVPLLLDAENLEVIRPLEGHDGPVKSLTFSPSSQFILSTSWDRTARLWDGISGAPVRSFVGHTATVTQGRFRPNSDQILTTSKDGTARLWDAATGAVIHVYEGHDGTVLDADWASNGSSFVTSSEDQRLRIWDARTHQLIRTIELGRASGFVRFSADGDLLFTQANDRGTNVWRVATGEPLVDRLAFEPLSPTLIAPMNDAQTLIVAGSEQSSIWKIEAAPWTDMGERENDWRDRHEQYRIAQRALGPLQSTEQDRSGIPMVIATNTETLRERVGRFLRVLDGEVDGPLNQGNAGALRLTGARKNALARLCFLEGDRITAIGGSPVQDRTTAMAAVEAWTDSGGNELRLTLSRGNKQFDVRIFALPLRQEERALTLERSDAITIIGALVNARGGSLDVAGQLSQEFVDDSGEEIDSPQSLFGFPYTLADTPPLNEYSLRLGLAMGDWIRSINGVPVRNMEALLDQLEGIVDLLEDGENLNLTIDIERGEFIRLSNTIEIR